MKITMIQTEWTRRLSLPGHERQQIGAWAQAELEGDEQTLENAREKFRELGKLCQQSVQERGIEFLTKTEGLRVVDHHGETISRYPFVVSGDTSKK